MWVEAVATSKIVATIQFNQDVIAATYICVQLQLPQHRGLKPLGTKTRQQGK
jgi:hypothetical protein